MERPRDQDGSFKENGIKKTVIRGIIKTVTILGGIKSNKNMDILTLTRHIEVKMEVRKKRKPTY